MSRRKAFLLSRVPGCIAVPSRYSAQVSDMELHDGTKLTCHCVTDSGKAFCPRHQFLLDHDAEIRAKKAAQKEARTHDARRRA